jgi:hypothetical protein
MAIAEMMVRQQNYALDGGSRQAFAEYLALRMRQPHFANARSVRNALDRIKLRQANRLVRVGGLISKEELMRIDAADVRQSRVFQGGLEANGHAETEAAGAAKRERGNT